MRLTSKQGGEPPWKVLFSFKGKICVICGSDNDRDQQSIPKDGVNDQGISEESLHPCSDTLKMIPCKKCYHAFAS